MGYMCLFQFWFPQGICLGVGLLGHMVLLFLLFKESPHHLPQWLYQFTFPPTVPEHSLFSTRSPAFIVYRLFDDGHFGVRWYLTEVLICISLLLSSSSLHWSLRKAFLSLLAILWNTAFKWVYLFLSPLPSPLFFSQLFVRPPQTIILRFCICFPWGWSWFLSPVQCHEPPSIVDQTLCLSDLVS